MLFLAGIIVGFLVAFSIMAGTHRVFVHEMAESLKHVRRVLGRGDVNTGMLMLENIEKLINKWRQPRVRDE